MTSRFCSPCGQVTERYRNGRCAPCQRAAVKRCRKAHPETHNAARRNWHRGKQEKRATRPRPAACEICGIACLTGRLLAWDHDHVTGKFRGWLCYRCNVGIGSFLNNPETLRKAAAYLEQQSSWL